jgi:hypothetical protein
VSKYAKGRHAIAECQRSGQKMRYRDLVEDGHVPGLLVHPDWWEPKHPQEIPIVITDPIALFRPAPEISIPAGYGDPENLDGGTTPTAPLGSANGVTEVDMTVGDMQMVSQDAVIYPTGEWLFIELDTPATYFVSRITIGTDTPTFVIPFTSPFVGAASMGNNFFIGVGP